MRYDAGVQQSILQIFTADYVFLKNTRPMSHESALLAEAEFKKRGIPTIVVPIEE
jgi:hypothetical protein